MIVNRKDGKWRITALACDHSWRADKLKENGERADNKLTVNLNKEQFDAWRIDSERGE